MIDPFPSHGHSVIMGKISREWQDTDSVLSYFGEERKDCYEKFVLGGIKEGKRPDLVDGGLLRSSGGWSKEKQSPRLTAKIPDLAFLAVQIVVSQ